MRAWMLCIFLWTSEPMTAIARTIACLVMLCVCTAPILAVQAQPPEQQEEFLPVDELPPSEQMPAAPLLISAYIFVVVVLFLYLVSVSRRLGVVQREVERLEGDIKRQGRA
jgi:CcmD family protein